MTNRKYIDWVKTNFALEKGLMFSILPWENYLKTWQMKALNGNYVA